MRVTSRVAEQIKTAIDVKNYGEEFIKAVCSFLILLNFFFKFQIFFQDSLRAFAWTKFC